MKASGFELVRQSSEKSLSMDQLPQINKAQPVPLSKFQGNIEQALQFYSNQIARLTYENNMLQKQLKSSLQEKKELADMVAAFKEQEKSQPEDNKKRVRRCANEIRRDYICPVVGCEKSYGTEGSMAQHMKFKHPHYKAPAGTIEIKDDSVKAQKIQQPERGQEK